MSSSLPLTVESVKGRQTVAVSAADQHRRLTELLRRKHLPLNTRCGQRGLCDGCIVELLAGRLVHAGTGQAVEATDQARSLRACEYRLAGGSPVRIRVPPRSLLAYEPQVVSDFRVEIPRAHDPLWQQIEIPRADIPAGNEWTEQLCRAVAQRAKRRKPVRTSPSLRAISNGDRVYATVEYRQDHWLIADAANHAAATPLGAAIDIGTTTVAVLLVDLRDGRVVASAGNFNRQMHLGDDVLTRINLCSANPTMTQQLQELILKETIAPLLAEAMSGTGASVDQLRCITVTGNTTMLHLLAGVDPSPMGIAPFRPVFLDHRVLCGDDEPFRSLLGVTRATIHLLPGAAAYVGADLTAGALATGLVYDEGPSLLVDVGTNGEIILKCGDRLYACATAAGPAFEGAGLTNGVRAADGAISHVKCGDHPFRLEIETIGNRSPIGLCGTAYIDALAEMKRIGLLNAHGRIEQGAVVGAAEHLVCGDDGYLSLRIASASGKTGIVISEPDVAHLLQAKAAIAAGILTLLARTGIRPDQIKTLYLAGGFGLHLVRENAIACGLLPGFTAQQIDLVGNSSLAGAYLALVDCGALDEITRLGQRMEVVELNADPQFESRFIDQLSLPE